jgi:hypothetical protein
LSTDSTPFTIIIIHNIFFIFVWSSKKIEIFPRFCDFFFIERALVEKVAVITDSVCCLPLELVKKYDIPVIPIYIIYKGKSYRDGLAGIT